MMNLFTLRPVSFLNRDVINQITGMKVTGSTECKESLKKSVLAYVAVIGYHLRHVLRWRGICVCL